jgi:signal transduction histidine kinase
MTRAAKRRLWLAYGGAGLLTSALVAYSTETSNHVSGRTPTGVLEAVIGLSFIGCGLLAWTRRPDNATGRLLVATGFAWEAGTLQSSNGAFLYTLGALTAAIVLAVFVQLLLAYPSGTLQSRFEVRLVVAGYVLAVVANVLGVLFDPHSRCDNCPTNLLFIAASPRTESVVTAVADAVALVLLATAVVLLVRHWRAASTVARRGLGSILLCGGVTVLFLALSFAVDPLSHGLSAFLASIAGLVLALLPFIFLVVLLRSRLARGGIAEVLVDDGESTSVAAAEARLQRALGDPSLRIGVWFLERRIFVGAGGDPFSADEIAADRVSVGLEDELGRPLALIVHDRALLEERELLDGALAAARLMLQRDRLQWELKMQLKELKRSRVRLVEAADTERRRLERNLHDGAQQRLVSLSVALRLAQAKVRSDPASTEELLSGASAELAMALQELRELARGLHPAILADRGLAAGLESLADRSVVPVELSVRCGERFAEPIEVAAFYVVSEALANVAKYSQATRAQVTVTKTDSTLELVVEDDGVGGADPAEGTGLNGLVDRVDALEGRLVIVSPPGGGTRVRAELPLLVHSPE